jgi:hypothetical protein
MLNIGFGSTHPIEKQLSNFNPLPFTFDRVICTCLEGPLQAFKCPDPAEQIRICGLDGREAKRAGKIYNTWKETQTLYWMGVTHERSGQTYQDLLDRLYDDAVKTSANLRQVLKQSSNERLVHTIGAHDTHQTVLTILELTSRLYEQRDKLRV